MGTRILGSILIILGTSIGAGMLALPIAAAQENFWMILFLMVISWSAMTAGAFALLETNLWLPPNSNLISMAGATLGTWAKGVTWIVYLLLLYSLLCAYLSGSGDILQALLASMHITVPRWAATILALLILGTLVYRGISTVDIANRGLMGLKFLAYIIIVAAIAPHIQLHSLAEGDFHWRTTTLMVMITSFGFAIVVPSLRVYLQSDMRALRKTLLIGSLLPLFIYLLWIAVVQGVIPRSGASGLISMAASEHTNSALMTGISQLVNNAWIASIAKLFISICAVTSFLGVSICLTDFIADGFKLQKRGKSNVLIYTLSYLPPLVIVLLAPGIFITALSYAGIWCIILLILLPALMLYSGRYWKRHQGATMVPGGKVTLLVCMLFAIILLGQQVFTQVIH